MPELGWPVRSTDQLTVGEVTTERDFSTVGELTLAMGEVENLGDVYLGENGSESVSGVVLGLNRHTQL